jgi:integrase/recombinase XerC
MGTTKFYQYLQFEKHYSEHTVKAYRTDIEQFIRYNNSSPEVDLVAGLSRQNLRGWIVFLLNSGQSASSVHRKISSIRRLCVFLIREGLMTSNPTLQLNLPKKVKKAAPFVAEDQMSKLLDEFEFASTFEGSRDRFIIDLLYQTGIRLSELIGIRLKDLDLEANLLKVTGKRNKERIIPFNSTLKDSLVIYLNYRNDLPQTSEYLIVTKEGEIAYPKLIYRIIHGYLTAVSSISKRSPHVLRHTFATHLLNRGADLGAIKELLGHANLSATQIYTHNDISSLSRAYKRAHPRA